MTLEQFLLFAEPLPEPMLLLAADGLILAGNRATGVRLGIPAKELVGRQLADVSAEPRDDVEHYLRACSRSRSLVLGALRLRAGVSHEVLCRTEGSLLQPRSEGRDALLLIRLTPRKSAVGEFVALNQRIADLGHEVQRRKRAEEAARQQAEWLRMTLLSIGDGVIVTDALGRVVSLNPVAESLTGWASDEAAGLPLESVFRIVNEATRQPVSNPALRAIESGLIVGLANHTILIARDGAERPIDDSAAPIRYENERIGGAVLVFRDITARRQADGALRESEEKLRLLADTIPQLAWMAKPDGHIMWYNRRWYEYTGTTPQQMEGWGWQSVPDPEVLPKVLELWKNSIASGEPFDMVFPLRGADNQFRPFLTRVNPLRDDSGRILYWFGTNTDISEIKRMEAALREADRRKDEFLATLAHELRNPLAPIRNALQILKMARVDAATAQQTREIMERQVHQLVRLVDDLLDVSRVMRGKIELRRDQVELATIVARAVETVQPLLEVQKHELEIAVSSESLLLYADPVRLAQVVGNLLTNAAKYTEPNGHIRLTANREGGESVLRVRDNGIGIAPDELPHVFELFVQVDHTTTRSQGGLGIGLTLVKNLVQMHGGSVEAHSAGLGKGCEFVVRLPLVAIERRELITETNDEKPRDAANRGNRLLVVDDNYDAGMSLATLLRLQGHDVEVVQDGFAALETAKTFRPALIFLDLGMPRLDGYEVARRIRQTPGLQTVVLAALTGWGQQEDRRRTAEAGFDHHLVKPPEPEAVDRIVAALPKVTDD